MAPARLALGLTLAVALASCVYLSPRTLEGACETALDSPVHNFCVVTPGALWRGERPTTADAQWLLQHGVRSVLSIQLDARHAFETTTVSAGTDRSVSYYYVKGFNPFDMLEQSRDDRMVAIFIAVAAEAPKPLYAHCRAGVDRVGVLIAAYRVIVERVDRETAIAELGRFHSPWIELEVRYIRGLSDARQQNILREADAWKARLQPLGILECRSGRCTFVPNPEGEIMQL